MYHFFQLFCSRHTDLYSFCPGLHTHNEIFDGIEKPSRKTCFIINTYMTSISLCQFYIFCTSETLDDEMNSSGTDDLDINPDQDEFEEPDIGRCFHIYFKYLDTGAVCLLSDSS